MDGTIQYNGILRHRANIRVGLMSFVSMVALALAATQSPAADGNTPPPGANLPALNLQADDGCEYALVDADGVPVQSRVKKIYTFEDLLRTDSGGLAATRPLMSMFSAQRVEAWFTHGKNGDYKPYSRRDSTFRSRDVTIYPMLSHGVPEMNGRRIEGHEEGLDHFMSYVRLASRGDGAASNVPLFFGPPGTGKTTIGDMAARAANNLAQKSEIYEMPTYEFMLLEEIPKLQSYARMRKYQLDGKEFTEEIPASLGRSPLTLLPESLQKRLVAAARPAVLELIDAEPIPFLEPDPHARRILNSMIEYYFPDGKYSVNQYLAMLKKHVRIVERTNISWPLMVYQGDDIPWEQLIAQENPAVMLTRGQENPLAYFLNGLFLRADGGILVQDEFYRNKQSLVATSLHITESKEIQRGGLDRMKVDIFPIHVANTESVINAQGEMTIRAARDRQDDIDFMYDLRMFGTAKLALLERGDNILLKPLKGLASSSSRPEDKDTTKFRKGTADEAIPMPDEDAKMIGPHGRFAVAFNMGPGKPPVLAAPWALEYMAAIGTVSRYITDMKVAVRVLNGEGLDVIKERFFGQAITRLRVLNGEIDVKQSHLDQLRRLSKKMEEGSSGISNRDVAKKWLPALIAEAQKPGNNNTITVRLVRQTLQGQFTDKAFRGSPVERARWVQLANDLALEWIAPNIRRDVLIAQANGGRALDLVYDDVMAMLSAASRFRNGYPTEYQTKDRRTATFQPDLIDAVKAAYLELNGEELDPSFVVSEAHELIVQYGENKRSEKLRLAIAEVAMTPLVAGRTASELTSISQINRALRSRDGEVELTPVIAQIRDVMVNEMGYSPDSFQATLEFVEEMERMKGKQTQQQP